MSMSTVFIHTVIITQNNQHVKENRKLLILN
jgi:hypothetical protein